MSGTGEHYVDNKAFLQALIEYRKACAKSKKAGRKTTPQIPEFIGECFLKIAQHLSYRPNFINYTYREDMVSDGVENCLMYMHNFNPAKSKNPFGYFTSVIFYAFVRRIQKERKHTALKYKMIANAITDGSTATSPDGSFQVDTELLKFENVQEFITKYDDYIERRKSRRRVPKDDAEPVVLKRKKRAPKGLE